MKSIGEDGCWMSGHIVSINSALDLQSITQFTSRFMMNMRARQLSSISSGSY